MTRSAYVAGAAPRPNDEGWVVVRADYTELTAPRHPEWRARDLSMPADEAAPWARRLARSPAAGARICTVPAW